MNSSTSDPPIQDPAVIPTNAIIHIGASSVSMLIAEYHRKSPNHLNVLEYLEQPVSIAEDVFEQELLSKATIERCVSILRRYLTSLSEYGITHEGSVKVVTTNILAEARNSEAFVNRIQVACGFEPEPLDEGDMTRLVYMGAERLLKSQPRLQKERLLVVHVGPGNTRVLFFENAHVAKYSSYRMGAHRVRESVVKLPTGKRRIHDLIRSHINGVITQIWDDFSPLQVNSIAAFGPEVQFAGNFLRKNADAIKTTRLAELLDSLAELNPAEIANRLGVNTETAHAMVPGLQANLSIVERFGLKSVTIPDDHFEASFLRNIVSGEFSTKRIKKEVLQSAYTLGRKYHIDPEHARHVEKLALTLFRSLADLHKLQAPDELLLRVAAILHECGSFVSRRSHHKHSLYLIRNSEIFGLNEADTLLVALVARYHRQSMPEPSHAYFRTLHRSQRIRVSKLAALLRVADSLDRGHSRKIRIESTRIKGEDLIINVGKMSDVSVEELALQAKGDLFTQIFGLDIVLETSL